MKPYYHLQRREKAGIESWEAFFGIALASCPALKATGASEETDATRRMAQQVDFIYALHNPEPPRTYALRYISKPNREAFLAGTLETILLAKVTSSSLNNAEVLAEYLFQELVVLLGSMLPDYSWRILGNEEDFLCAWSPFDLHGAYVAEIRRREDILEAGSLTGRPSLVKRTERAGERPHSRVYFVHPYIPRLTSFTRFLRAMLLYPSPLLVQVCLAPTSLTDIEEEMLLYNISQCERHLAHGTSSVLADARRGISSKQAGMVVDILGEQLVKLQDAPFLLNISIASPEVLQRHIVEALGVEITMPVGGTIQGDYKEAIGRKGGCDVVYPRNDEEFEAARDNIQCLEFNNWGVSDAPEKLARLRNLVDANEAVAAFRFPIAGTEGLVGMEIQASRLLPPPKEVVDISLSDHDSDVILIGENRYLGFPTKIHMLPVDRKQHMYIVGQTGTGKTTLLKTMILSDMKAGHGLAVIDPHGDLFEELLALVPEGRVDDVVVLDPSDEEYPVGLNVLEYGDKEEKRFIVRELKSIVERLLNDQYGNGAINFTGPVFYQYLQNGMLFVMSDPEKPGTILDFYNLFMVPGYYERWIPLKDKDNNLEAFVGILEKISPEITSRPRPGEISMGEYLASKFEDFVFDTRLRRIFEQEKSTIDFNKIMDQGKILLVNLAKGLLTEASSRFLGMLIMAKLHAAAMKRVRYPLPQRKPFYIYVDEFQSLTTSNFTMLLSEARKFGIGLVLANQFVHQITDDIIKHAIFGNVGTIVTFRVGQTDSELLEPHFRPYFDAHDLTNLPNWNACVKMSVNGQVVRPYSMHTLLPEEKPDEETARLVRELSRQKYGKKYVVGETG